MAGPGNQPFTLTVREELCARCGSCLANSVCRGKAFIQFDRSESPFVDMSRCWGCLACIPACPFSAVERVSSSADLVSDH